jgi:hypothetical protein
LVAEKRVTPSTEQGRPNTEKKERRKTDKNLGEAIRWLWRVAEG